MSGITLLGVLLLAGVDISIAPDQPLPIAYMDDPVILELRSEDDITVDADVRVQARHHEEPVDIRLEGLYLRGRGSHWVPLDAFPEERGFYAAHVTATGAGASSQADLLLCRIDRPLSHDNLPVCARSDAWDENSLLALRNAGVRNIQVNLAAADYASQLLLAKAMHFRIVPRLQVSDGADLESAIAMADSIHGSFCGQVAWWELSFGQVADQVPKITEALHRSGCSAPVTLVVPGAYAIPDVLDHSLLKYLDGLVLASGTEVTTEMVALRRALAAGGYERVPVYSDGTPLPGDARREGPALACSIFESLAAESDMVAFDARLVYNGAVREALPFLAGLSGRISATRYVGVLPTAKGVTALVFRKGANWLVVAWTEGDAASVPIWAEGAGDLLLTDALNNPQPLPALVEGQLALEVGASPLLLTGSGGSIVGIAAQGTARALVRELVEDATLENARHPYLTKLIKQTGDLLQDPGLSRKREGNIEEGIRPLLLDMLREFPVLEYRWQSGDAPKGPTLALVAGLARLARALCIVEEARGEPFVEPLSDRLSSCEAHQSVYLTSQTGDSPFAERGDQLLAEVRRLMEEARALDEAGRTIEAHGVAALAEWRARSLNALQEGAPLAPPPPEPVAPEPALEQAPAETQARPEPPEALEPGQPAGTRKVIHKVVSGDNPSAISKKYGVTLDDFMKWNKLTRRSVLSIGQELKAYVKRESE